MFKRLCFLLGMFLLILGTRASLSAEWTFLVYLDADNDLESAGIDDVNEMEQVGSDSNVNIVVLFDRIGGYDTSNGDWTDTRRGLITADTDPDIISSTLESVGEKNMGDPATLTEFVNWGITEYPANHYALILWNHGQGWRNAPSQNKSLNVWLEQNKQDKSEALKQVVEEKFSLPQTAYKKDSALKEVCLDFTSGGDALYTWELRQALEGVSINLDIIGLDACLMQMAEVAYEIRNHGSIMIGSEQGIPFDGFPYDTILADLAAVPTMTPGELAEVIVTRYAESYNGGYTLAALDLGHMDSLAAALSAFANGMITADSEWTAMVGARFNASYYIDKRFRDLRGFMDGMIEKSDSATVKSAAGQVNTVLQSAVISNHSSPAEGGNGLSIYLTTVGETPAEDYIADNLQLLLDSTWDELLQTASSKTVPDDRYEPNDSFEQAVTLELGAHEALCCKNDDWFRFYLPGDSVLTLALYHDYTAGDIDIELYDSSQTRIDYSENWLSPIELIFQDLPAPGYYYLRVYGYEGDENYYYDLFIHDANQNPGYHLIPTDYELYNYAGSTKLALGDDTSQVVSLPFDFEFYGETYQSVRISSNGYLTFGGRGEEYNNQPMPLPLEPNDIIAPFWDDLYPPEEGDGGVYYKMAGAPGDRKLIVTWLECQSYTYWGITEGVATFQAALFEDGRIRFNYEDVIFENDSSDKGISATVGLENIDGNQCYLYSYNEDVLENLTSFYFFPFNYTPAEPRWSLYE